MTHARRAAARSPPRPDRASVRFGLAARRALRTCRGPVVLLPGSTTGTWEWNDLIRRLALRHTVYAVALPGFDGRPPAAAPLFDRVTSDFWSMLDAQKIARPVVIGHSLGGTLAILLGEQHPDRLRGIVAVDALPMFPGTESVTTRAERVATAAQFAAPIDGASHADFLAYERVYMRTAGGVLDPALAGQIATLAATSDPRATAQWLREDVAADLRAGLAQITVPVLEIVPFNPADVATCRSSTRKRRKSRTIAACLQARRTCRSRPSRRRATSRCSTSPQRSPRCSTHSSAPRASRRDAASARRRRRREHRLQRRIGQAQVDMTDPRVAHHQAVERLVRQQPPRPRPVGENDGAARRRRCSARRAARTRRGRHARRRSARRPSRTARGTGVLSPATSTSWRSACTAVVRKPTSTSPDTSSPADSEYMRERADARGTVTPRTGTRWSQARPSPRASSLSLRLNRLPKSAIGRTS